MESDIESQSDEEPHQLNTISHKQFCIKVLTVMYELQHSKDEFKDSIKLSDVIERLCDKYITDGDVESQVITSLQHCLTLGYVQKNQVGRYSLLGPVNTFTTLENHIHAPRYNMRNIRRVWCSKGSSKSCQNKKQTPPSNMTFGTNWFSEKLQDTDNKKVICFAKNKRFKYDDESSSNVVEEKEIPVYVKPEKNSSICQNPSNKMASRCLVNNKNCSKQKQMTDEDIRRASSPTNNRICLVEGSEKADSETETEISFPLQDRRKILNRKFCCFRNQRNKPERKRSSRKKVNSGVLLSQCPRKESKAKNSNDDIDSNAVLSMSGTECSTWSNIASSIFYESLDYPSSTPSACETCPNWYKSCNPNCQRFKRSRRNKGPRIK